MAFKTKVKPTASGGPLPMPDVVPHAIEHMAKAEGWRVPPELYGRLPYIHLLLYGDSGSGKSTFAATFVSLAQATGKPMLVLGCDPPGKMAPYREVGTVLPVQDAEMAKYYSDAGIMAEDVVDEDGLLLIRLEYYLDPDPANPVAADQLEARLTGFEHQATAWSTVVFDSMTFFMHASLRRAAVRNPIQAGKNQVIDLTWYSSLKADVERTLKSQAVWWLTNVVAIFHTNQEKAEFADTLVRGILATGKLPSELPPGFDEIYRVKLIMGQKSGEDYKRVLQTRHDTIWAATSVTAKAPNPCEPNFDALWQNYVESRQAKGGA